MRSLPTLAQSMLCLSLLTFHVQDATPVSLNSSTTSSHTDALSNSSHTLSTTTPVSIDTTNHSGTMNNDRSEKSPAVKGGSLNDTTSDATPITTSSGKQTSGKPGSTAKQTETSPPSITSTTTATTSTSSVEMNAGSIVVVFLVVIILLLLVFVLLYKWHARHSGEDSSAPRLILSVRERVRGWVRTLEDRLGFRLWPGKRGGVEGDEEEGEGDGEEGKKDGGAGVGGVRGGRRGDEEEEEGDSSDDYSSLEGIDLRERAKNREEEEEEEEKKEEKRKKEGGQDEAKGENDGKKEGEVLPSVMSGEEKGEEEMVTCDLTKL